MKIPITQFFGARRPLIICLWFAGFVFKTIGGDHREKPRSSIILIDQQYLDSFTLTFSNFGLEQVAIGQLSHMTKRERKFLSILAGTRPLDGFLHSSVLQLFTTTLQKFKARRFGTTTFQKNPQDAAA